MPFSASPIRRLSRGLARVCARATLGLIFFGAFPAFAQIPDAPASPLVISPKFVGHGKLEFSYAIREKISKFMANAEWLQLLAYGRALQKEQPSDPVGWIVEGRARYQLGDLEGALALWKKLPSNLTMADYDLTLFGYDRRDRLAMAQAITAKYPKLKLRPWRFERGDSAGEESLWEARALALLRAKKYDEIEKVAASLQKSQSANVKGTPHLAAFFRELRRHPDEVALWKKARPASSLAKLAWARGLVDEAWAIRGTGDVHSITPEMSEQMDAVLQKAARELTAIPRSKAQNSPLFFQVALEFNQLAGDRETMQQISSIGLRKFPNYLPLSRIVAYQLDARWFGEPGESEAFAAERANKIGGENGDIFYGRVIWNLLENFGANLGSPEKTLAYNASRALRGLRALEKRRPSSVSLFTAQLYIACDAGQWSEAARLLARPDMSVLTTDWVKTPEDRTFWPHGRMDILSSWITTKEGQEEWQEQRLEILRGSV